MIIDCDTHLMPRDAFDGVGGKLSSHRPVLQFDQAGLYSDVDFPGDAPQVAGTSPLGAPGSGAMFRSLWDIEARMADYEGRLGIEMHIVFAPVLWLVVLSHRTRISGEHGALP